MNQIAVRVERLSKQYTLGVRSHNTFRELMTERLKACFRPALDHEHENPPNTIWALKDVSFEVKQGEFVSIVGSNGSGKSTLLKILSRITEPTEGCAEIHGNVASLLEVALASSLN